MTLEERKIVYRQQMETANINTGKTSRDIMQACYIIIVIDTETGQIIPTNKHGIIDIPLSKYPELQSDIEAFVPKFISAFESEYAEKLLSN